MERRGAPTTCALLLVFFTFLGVVAGCGDGRVTGNEDSSLRGGTISDADRYFWPHQPGDIRRYTETRTLLSSGRSETTTATEVQTYSQVQAIPARYGYHGSLAGPFLYCETSQDGALYSEKYLVDSTEVIDDDLDAFTNIDFVTKSGDSFTPDPVVLGKTYCGIVEGILFSSATGDSIGVAARDFSITCEDVVPVTVPAGTFEALNCGFVSTYAEIRDGHVTTVAMTGTGWFAKDIGVVKYNATGMGSVDGVSFNAAVLRLLTTTGLPAAKEPRTLESDDMGVGERPFLLRPARRLQPAQFARTFFTVWPVY